MAIGQLSRIVKLMKTEEPLSATVEEYLETIYNMSAEDEVVIGAAT